MRNYIAVVLLLFLSLVVLASSPQKQIIVSYPKDTPISVLEQAKDAIKEAGGTIVHEYQLIKGFAAKAPSRILETIEAWGSQYDVLIEEDQPITINKADS